MFRWLTISLLTISISAWADNDKVEKVAQDLGITLEDMDKVLILGETEWFYIEEVNHNFKARIDTGATTSSISAIDIRSYKKGGKRFVDFKIAHDDWESQLLTRPVERRVGIVQSSSDEADSRYVVKLDVQIGNHKETTEFTLVDRSQLNYPMLIGRSFIEDKAIVDVAHKYINPKVKIEKKDDQQKNVEDKDKKQVDTKANNENKSESEKSTEDETKKSSNDKTSEKEDTDTKNEKDLEEKKQTKQSDSKKDSDKDEESKASDKKPSDETKDATEDTKEDKK